MSADDETPEDIPLQDLPDDPERSAGEAAGGVESEQDEPEIEDDPAHNPPEELDEYRGG